MFRRPIRCAYSEVEKGIIVSEALNNPNELMVGIEDYVGIKLEWNQDSQSVILPIESLRIIHDYLESVNTVYQIGR